MFVCNVGVIILLKLFLTTVVHPSSLHLSLFPVPHTVNCRSSYALAMYPPTRLELAPLNELQIHLPAYAVEPEFPHLLVPHACVRCDACRVLCLRVLDAVLARLG